MIKISRRQFVLGAASIVFVPAFARASSSAPATTNNIIDLSHHKRVRAADAKASGVVAIIHKATEGTDFRDKVYKDAKRDAKAAGLLWGSFHFSNNRSVKDQVRNYLDYAEPEDDEVICLDFEHNKGAEMSLAQAEDFIERVHDEVGRYPMLYGGAWMRECVGRKPNATLAKCPLWYRRYRGDPKALPVQIWPTYTLWQYTDGSQGGYPRTVNGLTCDRNRFQGTDEELRAAWPFTRRA